MVLNVTRTLNGSRVEVALELAEHLPVGLAGDIGQHVQSTAMGHANAHTVEFIVGGLLQHGVEQGDQRLAALEAEALLAHVLGLQERLEGFCLVELLKNAHLLVVIGLFVGELHVIANPEALLGILNVHVLQPHGATVGVTKDSQHFAQRQGARAGDSAGHKLSVKIPEGEPVGFDLEIGVGALHVLQGINVGHQVAAHAVGVDELLHSGGFVDRC
ncbi:unannotated protein [freshwater metagenome]|uniref:Unannotated protein n=1 Tax=freshwater metagenome TaxID=449393 RepID=A0A6J7G9L2_9ZZZZ